MSTSLSDVEVRRFLVSPEDPSFSDAFLPIATCYQRAFGYDTAWNEGMTCRVCSVSGRPVKFNFEDRRIHCDNGHVLEEFWPISGIISEMQQNLRKSDAVLVYCGNGDGVQGGALTYTMTPEELEAYLRLPGISRNVRRRFPTEQKFFYLAEMFADPSSRNQGVGGVLFRERHRHMITTADTRICIFRTKRGHETNASVTYLWYRRAFNFEVIARYRDADDRVILTQSIDHISAVLAER